MLEQQYIFLRDNFRIGAVDANGRNATCVYGPVTIPDRLVLFDKKTKVCGQLAMIGQRRDRTWTGPQLITIKNAQTGDYVEAPYTRFLMTDANGDPQEDSVLDITGQRIVVGSYVAFSASERHGSFNAWIGRVIGFTDDARLKVEHIQEQTYRSATGKTTRYVRSGRMCVLLEETLQAVTDFKTEWNKA